MRETTYRERFPEWRSSDGAWREKKGDGKEKLSGYEGSDREKDRKDEPKKILDLSNAYGCISAGVDKKQELVLVASQRKSKEVEQVSDESETLSGQTGTKVPLLTGNFQTNSLNSDWKAESAFSYREKTEKTPYYILNKLKALQDKTDLEVQETMMPFLSVEKEKTELAALQEKARRLSSGSEEKEGQEDEALRRRIQFLTTVVADKERQKKVLCGKLQGILEEARQEKDSEEELPFWLRRWEEEEETEDTGEDDGDEADEEDEEEDEEERRKKKKNKKNK